MSLLQHDGQYSHRELAELAASGLVSKNRHGVYCCSQCGQPFTARTWKRLDEMTEADHEAHWQLYWRGIDAC